MNFWLLKSEPDVFSFDDLKKRPKKTEPWNGVRNYQVRNMMRDNQKVLAAQRVEQAQVARTLEKALHEGAESSRALRLELSRSGETTPAPAANAIRRPVRAVEPGPAIIDNHRARTARNAVGVSVIVCRSHASMTGLRPVSAIATSAVPRGEDRRTRS